MRKVKLIYNPYSGEKKIVNELDKIIDIYQKNDYTVVPHRLDFTKDMSQILEDKEDTYNHFLIAGGDGTLDTIVNTMKLNQVNIPIGILPTGTANDFAKTLDIPFDIEKAVENVIHSKPKSIDIGKVNDKYFINVASAGMFTDVSQKINKELKNYMGKVSYYLKGLEEALYLRTFNIDLKSTEINYNGDMYLMLVFNGKTAGNINLAYKAQIDDGLLDVLIFKSMNIQKTIPLLINVLRGEHLENNFDEVLYFKTDKLNIECSDDLITDIDGERGPNFPLSIECIKNGIQILGIDVEKE